MKSHLCKRSLIGFATIALAATSGAFLTACSKASGNNEPLSASLGLDKRPPLPSPPGSYRKCFRKPMALPKSPKADDKVLSAVSWGNEKQICGENLLQWYDGLQQAEGGHPAPPPAVQPPARPQPKPRS